MHIVLFEPKIPQNVGNIARTCVVTGSKLTLVEPLGFSLSERHLKRAGLDYWKDLNVDVVKDLRTFLDNQEGSIWFFSSKAKKRYDQASYNQGDLLIFGSETEGLPSWVHKEYSDRLVALPMVSGQRCLNLATSVGISVYECWRQQDFQNSTFV